MKGLGRMFIAGASFAVTLGCQGCVHTTVSDLLPELNPNEFTATRMVDAEHPPIVANYAGSLSRAEIRERAALHTPVSYESLRAQTDIDADFSSTRLYSSQTLRSFAAEREQQAISQVPVDAQSVSAEITLSAPAERTGLGLDVGIAPRVTVTREGEIKTRRFGGEVRIGQNFDLRGEADDTTGWYIFAGADGEALVWDPGRNGSVSFDDMTLRDRVTVGDMQAGVSFQRGEGQLSISYIRREVEYRERNLGASENEDFAGVTFTMKR